MEMPQELQWVASIDIVTDAVSTYAVNKRFVADWIIEPRRLIKPTLVICHAPRRVTFWSHTRPTSMRILLTSETLRTNNRAMVGYILLNSEQGPIMASDFRMPLNKSKVPRDFIEGTTYALGVGDEQSQVALRVQVCVNGRVHTEYVEIQAHQMEDQNMVRWALHVPRGINLRYHHRTATTNTPAIEHHDPTTRDTDIQTNPESTPIVDTTSDTDSASVPSVPTPANPTNSPTTTATSSQPTPATSTTRATGTIPKTPKTPKSTASKTTQTHTPEPTINLVEQPRRRPIVLPQSNWLNPDLPTQAVIGMPRRPRTPEPRMPHHDYHLYRPG